MVIIPVYKEQVLHYYLKLKVMKTRFTLIAPILVFTFLLTITFSADAQRRSTRSDAVKQSSEQENSTNDNKKQNAVRNSEQKTKATETSSSGRRTSVQENKPAPSVNTPTPETRRRENSLPQERKVNQRTTTRPDERAGTVKRRTPETNRTGVRKAPAPDRRESSRENGTIRNNRPNNAAATPRARKEHNRTIYRVDSKDNRYTPAREFKGNKSNWSAGYAVNHVHYHKRGDNFYRDYDHRRYVHWDRSWETYRWNVNSWRDYYSGYHPYSYRYHKHYFYHPGYGHVIRRFSYKPVYFVHNNVRYYSYNGHFFRHFRGVGYVLADMPYGLVFQRLPDNYERVFVNGYMYFRVGNLFFENHPHGFALIHYPERYFALDDDYYNGGYYRETDYYIYR
jgi:hypothetical protein